MFYIRRNDFKGKSPTSMDGSQGRARQKEKTGD